MQTMTTVPEGSAHTATLAARPALQPSVRQRAAEAYAARRKRLAQALRAELVRALGRVLFLQVAEERVTVEFGRHEPTSAYVDEDGLRFFVHPDGANLWACAAPTPPDDPQWIRAHAQRVGDWADLGELLADTEAPVHA